MWSWWPSTCTGDTSMDTFPSPRVRTPSKTSKNIAGKKLIRLPLQTEGQPYKFFTGYIKFHIGNFRNFFSSKPFFFFIFLVLLAYYTLQNTRSPSFVQNGTVFIKFKKFVESNKLSSTLRQYLSKLKFLIDQSSSR